MPFYFKIIQFFQFNFFQSFYLLLLKCILGLMNYGIGGDDNGERGILKRVNKYFIKAKTQQPIMLDVGANIGQYLNDLNIYISIASKIYSFEPILHTYKKLSKNIPANTKHNITLVNQGLGIKDATVTINFAKDGTDGEDSCASLFSDNIKNFVTDNVTQEDISITSIDNFCKKNNINHIDFLKIDIEGYELECIKGAVKMIQNSEIDIIQVEHNRCAIASRTFLRDYWDIFSEQYTICRPLSGNRGLYEIKKYDIYLENFTYINYVFIKKDIFNKYFK